MFLENELLRVGLDGHTGGIVSVFDKARQRELIGTTERTRLFRLVAPSGDLLSNHIDGVNPAVCSKDCEATLKYSVEGIEAIAHLVLRGGAIEATLDIRNGSPLTIEEIHFPVVNGVDSLPDGMVTLPNLGRRHFDPLGPGFSGDRRHAEQFMAKMAARYPERLVTAWMDYSSPEGGIAFEARHQDFQTVDFFLSKTVAKKTIPFHRSLDFMTAFPHRIKPGEGWQSPPVRMVVHQGDWHVVADEHRAWVETWITKADRPAKFAHSVGWHYLFLKHQDGAYRHTYADVPRLAESALRAGCPYILLFGWHEGGHDNHYFYRYVPNREWGGEKALAEAVNQARAIGAEVIPFFNGTLANVSMTEHKEFGQAWEARTREGAPYHAGDWSGFTVDVPSSNRARMHHEICPCEGHAPYFLETAARLVGQYGFGNIQLDQISIKMMPCFNEAHRHARPDLAYRDGIRHLLEETRALVRPGNPDGIMLAEGINEFTAQWCDGAWTWDFFEDVEPILFSLPWLLPSTAIDAMDFAAVNRAFAHKVLFDLRIGGGDELITDYPPFADHVRSLAELKGRTVPYYADAAYRDQEGFAWADQVEADAVFARCFRDRGAGTMSVVVAEMTGVPAEARLHITWPCDSACRVESSRGPSTAAVLMDNTLSLALAPWEVIILCLNAPA